MHMQGTPSDMQLQPEYDDVTLDVRSFFAERMEWLTKNGIDRKRIIVDPGIGFGKTLNHNITLLKNLDKLANLGVPVLLGHSRKRFLGDLTGVDEEKKRDLATAVVSALCANKDIAMIRVHDVASTRQALTIARAFQS
jgi:dihydropteroate synthase